MSSTIFGLIPRALARAGKTLLHVDSNDFYGGHWAALSLDDLTALAEMKCMVDSNPYRDVVVQMDRSKLAFSRAYAIELSPHMFYANSEMAGLLVASKVYNYLEFKAFSNFYILEETSSRLSRVPSSKEDIFTSPAIDLIAKRHLMRFMKFALQYEDDANHGIWKGEFI